MIRGIPRAFLLKSFMYLRMLFTKCAEVISVKALSYKELILEIFGQSSQRTHLIICKGSASVFRLENSYRVCLIEIRFLYLVRILADIFAHS